jgi:alpha-amylase/alpha-mannosidase (GH57 family)
MAEVALAFLWHQHQPYYPDDIGGENPMPWVRLHGVKDYVGMALHLLEFPEMRCTINLVPSLLLQLQAYTERGAVDKPLRVSRIPSDGLSEADSLYLLDTFFMANPDHMIRPLARYYELLQRRALGKNSAEEVLRRYAERDLRDLQVLFNLAWIHPLVFERDAELRELLDKGRNYSESDKNWVLDKHLEILAEIIPLHRRLAESGQVELTTTPFFHPILPLLLDKKLAREAMPDVKLPRYTGGYPEDAETHVRRALEFHTQTFGARPRGMWPAEGSVCQSMIPLLVQHGVRWMATDEEILSRTTQGFVSRDHQGHVQNPDRMYRPYTAGQGDKELAVVFRDHALSDLIGFHYQRSSPEEAADDFLRHLTAIGNAVTGEQPALVSVILDGENCWEHYPGGGVTFLRSLYERCTKTPGIMPVRIGAFLEKYPPSDRLPHLFAGSWIYHNFAIWIGHGEDNTAWDALHRTREHLRARAQQGAVPDDAIARAWEEIYIAEGSDWFWWYGDDHSSAQDELFDYLFRKHLQNVYVLLGDPPPPELSRPIKARGQHLMHTLPRSLLEIKVDGRETFFEWLEAGRYTSQNERGTMALVTPGPIKDVYFGFDLENLFIRVDFDDPADHALAGFDAVRVGFMEPPGWELLVTDLAAGKPKARLVHEGASCPTPSFTHSSPPGAGGEVRLVGFTQRPTVRVGLDRILEIAVPFALLLVKADQPLQFFIDLLEGRQSRDRAPREGTIHLTCPSPDFEQIMWNV